jgi:hypothetical protein
MPYVLHKGAYFEVVESILSDPSERLERLDALRANVPLWELCGFDSTNLGTPPNNAGVGGTGDRMRPGDRVAHMAKDWFGMTNAGGRWVKQPQRFPTGFWTGFQGDPELILREGMIRAIEVSLDLEPGGTLDDLCAVGRMWPIDLYWICQSPVFQCWVLWRQADDSAEGHVTLLITTPAATGYPLTSKITRPVSTPPPYTDPEYASPPPPLARRNRQGMWAVGHEAFTPSIVPGTVPTPLGDIAEPVLVWRAVDQTKVVCVSPAEWEGGTLHAGRPYMAP